MCGLPKVARILAEWHARLRKRACLWDACLPLIKRLEKTEEAESWCTRNRNLRLGRIKIETRGRETRLVSELIASRCHAGRLIKTARPQCPHCARPLLRFPQAFSACLRLCFLRRCFSSAYCLRGLIFNALKFASEICIEIGAFSEMRFFDWVLSLEDLNVRGSFVKSISSFKMKCLHSEFLCR